MGGQKAQELLLDHRNLVLPRQPRVAQEEVELVRAHWGDVGRQVRPAAQELLIWPVPLPLQPPHDIGGAAATQEEDGPHDAAHDDN